MEQRFAAKVGKGVTTLFREKRSSHLFRAVIKPMFLFHLPFAGRVYALGVSVSGPEMDYLTEENRKNDYDDESRDHIVAQSHTWFLAMSILLPPTFW
jgi:hypothetical protein